MKKCLNILILLFSLIFLSACTPKITVKSLHPSQMPNEKLHVLHIEEFDNDKLSQKEKIEEKLSNIVINQKKVFKLKDNHFNIDAIIAGEVLESTLNYDIYYKRSLDRRCRVYKFNETTKKNECISYYYKHIPCENRDYKVRTQIKVLDPNDETILFSKIYEKTKHIDECYENYNYALRSFHRDKHEVNTKLASLIAQDVLNDISPHYKYYDLEIIKDLDSKNLNFTQKQEDSFKNSAKQIEDRNLLFAQNNLLKLNRELKNKSWEVLYNIALTYEATNYLEKAKNYYIMAFDKAIKDEDKTFVNHSITRVQRNLEEKIKAKSQLQ